MQNHETKGNDNDISAVKLCQLINAISLLKKLIEKENEAKGMRMPISPGNYYPEVRCSFSNN